MNVELKEALLRARYYASVLLNKTKCHEALCVYKSLKDLEVEIDNLMYRYQVLADAAANITTELIAKRKLCEAASEHFGPLFWQEFVEAFNESRNSIGKRV